MEFDSTRALCDYINRRVDLQEYIETDAALRVSATGPSSGGKSYCPFPDHSESRPSFHIYYDEEEGVWSYYCWGCNRGGDVISFFQNYHRVGFYKALKIICERFNINPDDESIMTDLGHAKRKFSLKKRMECAHITTSNQCRMLLRKNYKKYSSWVAEQYKRMNRALAEDDIEYIEELAFTISRKIREDS